MHGKPRILLGESRQNPSQMHAPILMLFFHNHLVVDPSVGSSPVLSDLNKLDWFKMKRSGQSLAADFVSRSRFQTHKAKLDLRMKNRRDR